MPCFPFRAFCSLHSVWFFFGGVFFLFIFQFSKLFRVPSEKRNPSAVRWMESWNLYQNKRQEQQIKRIIQKKQPKWKRKKKTHTVWMKKTYTTKFWTAALNFNVLVAKVSSVWTLWLSMSFLNRLFHCIRMHLCVACAFHSHKFLIEIFYCCCDVIVAADVQSNKK